MFRSLATLILLAPSLALADMPPIEESELQPGGEGTVEPMYNIDVFALPAANLGII